MKSIHEIRDGLETIPGALGPILPHPGRQANRSGFPTTTVWPAENPNNINQPGLSVQDVFFGSSMGGPPREFDPVFEVPAEMDEAVPALGGAEGKRIRENVHTYGIDALGWYVPFHSPGWQWGVYVPISGIAFMAKEVFGGLSAKLATTAQLGFHAILNHELFHFAAEYTIAQSELMHREPWYLPAVKGLRDRGPGYSLTEECMANAYMLNAFRTSKPSFRVRGKLDALREFTKKQPDGYNDAINCPPSEWAWGTREVIIDYAVGPKGVDMFNSNGTNFIRCDWEQQFPIHPRIDWRYCPIHLVHDESVVGMPPECLNFFSRLGSIDESVKFASTLNDLPDSIRRAWERTKEKLQTAVTAGADLKPWPKGGKDVWSVRVNKSIRAHLLRPRETANWLALEIGGHKLMGHD
jgi:hypothetical protein